MNVTLPEKSKGTKRRIAIYIILFIICAISTGIAIYQFFADEKLDVVVGMQKQESEDIQKLKTEFDNLFKNKIISDETKVSIKKLDSEQDIVYTQYTRQEKEANNYDIDVSIPNININDNITKKFNEEIKRNFQITAEKILQMKNTNIVYTVNYFANIENNILNVNILSTFKEGNKAQRTIVKTYNYNLETNQEVSLRDLMQIKNINENTVQNAIKIEIEQSKEQTDKLREMGYNIFSRNITDDMYKIENASDFFIYDNNLYIIYAYGNKNTTSEMDVIIL